MDDQFDQLELPRREKRTACLLQLDPGPEHEQGQSRSDVGEHLERHVQPWGQLVQLREDEKHRQKAGEKEGVPEQPVPRPPEGLGGDRAEEGELTASYGQELHERQGESQDQRPRCDAGLS